MTAQTAIVTRELTGTIILQHLQGLRELVRATGAAALAVDAFEAGDNIGLIHSFYESADALKITVAAAGVSDAFEDVPFKFNVYLAGADHIAGLEGSPADAPFSVV